MSRLTMLMDRAPRPPGIRKAALRLGLTLVGVTIVGALAVFDPLAPLLGDDEVVAEAARGQSTITETSLVATVEAEGELVFTAQRDLSVAGSGTLTSVAPVGSTVTASSVLFEVDGEPIVALIGDVPAWRTMAVDEVGVDVAQLEENLVALGYDPGGQLAVDDTFTSYTSDLVGRWQEDVGLEVTGTVAFGTMAFVPDGAQVTAVGGTVGEAAAGAPVASVSSTDRELRFTVEAEVLDTIEVGTVVSARLPDRSTVEAVVAELGPAGDGTWTATATLEPLSEGAVLPDGISVPVTVSWTEQIAAATKTVRANALTRLDRGGYVVEVVGANETTFVEVEIGATSGSTVEVITDLPVGTAIISP